jgi:cellobiose phosphorylase
MTIPQWAFQDDYGTFTLSAPQRTSYLYFPLANAAGMMSSITPRLRGDAKTGQHSFLLTPASVEDLHHGRYGREFWLHLDDGSGWSASGGSPQQEIEDQRSGTGDEVQLTAGVLWHRIRRRNNRLGIQADTLNFVPARGGHLELMEITITNIGTLDRTITPTAAIPIFARSADSIRDHRHVTSLLHRITTTARGVVVKPTLIFDERGHRTNTTTYGVFGSGPDGALPVGYFPLVHDFVGEGGSLDWPLAVTANACAHATAGESFAGYEALGGIRFDTITLGPGENATYRLVLSIAHDGDYARHEALLDDGPFGLKLDETRTHWRGKLDQLAFHTGARDFDCWLRWVTIQPMLRRIYGCSFLPYHDYGRGGRGWRDLWQDCLALLLCEPDGVADLLLGNFAGVRIDGSNATIIGAAPGEFVADRNSIARVWMDHAAWPWLTTRLYLDQTGDLDFLLRPQTYFRDRHINRCREHDAAWSPADGMALKTRNGEVHSGSILEHLIIQNVTSFLNVGDHNNIRLEGADWNDGMDLAGDQGESVAFSSLYGRNLLDISAVLEALEQRRGVDRIPLLEDVRILLDSLDGAIDYASPEAKRARLDRFLHGCAEGVSGRMVNVSTSALAADLRRKGRWILEHVRASEWVTGRDGTGWFNGYYDNDGRRVESDDGSHVRMTLPGQVFAVMSGAATDEQVEQVLRSADRHLWDDQVAGYRLNSDFKDADLKLGRCFGFAYGHKENGAMFCHMAVMFAYALYARGRARAGYRILDTIHQHCRNFEVSRVYPGIPEYINDRGRGMYPYLTGSASWYLFTLLTMACGIRGEFGDLLLRPQLLPEQFDGHDEASVQTQFANRRLRVVYRNTQRKDAGAYRVRSITSAGRAIPFNDDDGGALIKRSVISALDASTEHELHVELD